METPAERPTPPPLFRRHLRRPRLTRLIDESVAQSVIVTGAAGYGKTTLAREWAQGRENILWYRATTASADVAAFSVDIAKIATPIAPKAGDRLQRLVQSTKAPEKAVRVLAEALAEELAEWPRDAWLVIDDYHLVADSAPVEEFVDWLLTLTPLRLLVTSRRRPAWASARRRLHGEILEIRQEQLRMTDEEARSLLEGARTGATETLVQQARGWPALIGLAALAASSDLPGIGISETLYRYFAEEVLRQEPTEVQEFMLLASLPAALTPATVRLISSAPVPQQHIEYLAEIGLLHDTGGAAHAFHPLLRDFLRHKLDHEAPDVVCSLREQLLSHYASTSQWEEAFDLAMRMERLGEALDVVARAAPTVIASGRLETVERWLAACGAGALQHSGCVLARGEVLVRRGHLAEAAALTRDLAERLPEASEDAAPLWYLAGRAKYLLSEYAEALECHRRSRMAAKSGTHLKDALWGLFLTSLEMELPNAASHLQELEELASDDVDDRLRVATGKVRAAAYRGSYQDAWRTLEPLLPFAPYSREPTNFLAHAALVCNARAQYALGRDFAMQALQYCSKLGLAFATTFCLLHRIESEIGLRSFDEAAHLLDRVWRMSEDVDESFIQLQRRSLALKLIIAENGPSAAWDNVGPLPHGELHRAAHGEFLSLASLAAAGAGNAEAALELAEAARNVTTSVEARYFSLFSQLIVRCQLDERPSTLGQDVAAAFAAAASDEFLEALVVAYRACPPLLLIAGKDGPTCDLIRRVARFANDVPLLTRLGLASLTRSPRRTTRPWNLTRREEEVLQLMSLGMSNRDISRQLFISPSTTKVHVHKVLRKTGSASRLQAVIKYRELSDFGR